MGFELAWMRAEAPYMPVATAGLLSVLEDAGVSARAGWGDVLTIEADVSVEAVAELIAAADLPSPDRLAWPGPGEQAVKSSLAPSGDSLAAYRALVHAADPPEQRLLRGLVTDQAVDNDRSPRRTTLLRGAKSDLAAFRERLAGKPDLLAEELRSGPRFGPGETGRALGLVPEVQTFGGSVGRKASAVNAESRLLSLLLRHGVLALPPNGVRRAGGWGVGGPLVGDQGSLSWPRWTTPCALRALRAVFSFAEVYAERPDAAKLRARGVEAVYRSAPVQLSTTVAVFRWGRRVA